MSGKWAALRREGDSPATVDNNGDYPITYKVQNWDLTWQKYWTNLVVAVLVILKLIIAYFIYSRCCTRREEIRRARPSEEVELQPVLPPRSVGIDPRVRERIPSKMYQTGQELPFQTETCPCCMEEFVDGHMLTSLPSCHHTFHTACILTHLDGATTCPYCRQTVVVSDEDIC